MINLPSALQTTLLGSALRMLAAHGRVPMRALPSGGCWPKSSLTQQAASLDGGVGVYQRRWDCGYWGWVACCRSASPTKFARLQIGRRLRSAAASAGGWRLPALCLPEKPALVIKAGAGGLREISAGAVQQNLARHGAKGPGGRVLLLNPVPPNYGRASSKAFQGLARCGAGRTALVRFFLGQQDDAEADGIIQALAIA